MDSKKSFIDRWLDKRLENAVDSSTDFLSKKFQVYLTAFYLVAMLVYVSYSVICLNDIGKLSDTWMIVIGVVFYLAFAVMAVLSIWGVLKAGLEGDVVQSMRKIYLTSKILRRILGLIAYVMAVVTLLQTWDAGIQYRLFSAIMLIAFTAGNLWIVVNDIYQKKLAEKREAERIRLLAEMQAKKDASHKVKVKINAEKVAQSAVKISSTIASAIKAKEASDKLKSKLKSRKKDKPQDDRVSQEGDVPAQDVIEIKTEDIQW